MNNRNRKIERGEVFVEVEGFGNRYEISNRGRLWSNVSNQYIGHKDKNTGYIHAILYNEEGEKISTTIHRLVGEAFIPNDDPENKTQINHKNYKRTDNRVENLEWVSPQENMEYSHDNILEAAKKRWGDPEYYTKVVEGTKKKWKDPEFREKMKDISSNLMKERRKDPEFQKRRQEAVKEARSKPVEQYNIDGELVGTYPSITAAQEATGIFSQNICQVLKGKHKTAGGYLWKYKEE